MCGLRTRISKILYRTLSGDEASLAYFSRKFFFFFFAKLLLEEVVEQGWWERKVEPCMIVRKVELFALIRPLGQIVLKTFGFFFIFPKEVWLECGIIVDDQDFWTSIGLLFTFFLLYCHLWLEKNIEPELFYNFFITIMRVNGGEKIKS